MAGTLVHGPAERFDLIVDFSTAANTQVTLLNLGPDEPYSGGVPGVDFASANPQTTGQIMRFNVAPASSPDSSTHPSAYIMPALDDLGKPVGTMQVC